MYVNLDARLQLLLEEPRLELIQNNYNLVIPREEGDRGSLTVDSQKQKYLETLLQDRGLKLSTITAMVNYFGPISYMYTCSCW